MGQLMEVRWSGREGISRGIVWSCLGLNPSVDSGSETPWLEKTCHSWRTVTPR